MRAFLPIKDHSERVPGKNFRELGGKPLFKWILDALLSSKYISEVIIDTDSNNPMLTNLLKDKRIMLKERNPLLRGDEMSMNRIIGDYVDLESDELILMTHVTNPFLSQITIDASIDTFLANQSMGYDSIVSVDRFQSRFYDDSFVPINHDPNNLVRTQDLSPVFRENSCIYVFSGKSFANNSNNRVGLKPFLFETPILESLDIDTEEDWKIAELYSRFMLTSSIKKDYS